ncbi:4Fe-4S binding protein [uncultured Sphaerochaeta sp.]|uniref:4Fe-4S binding protein n=1 Tax=uncultured Sphaerochaeta sp. TaxID=886478 RepID=UPI00374A76A8
MNRLPLWLTRLKKPAKVRLLVQIGIFLGALLLPVGIFHLICPFGGIETLTRLFAQGLYIPKTGLPNLIILSAVLLTTILVGPVFCGWLCPLGSIQEWIRSLAKKIGIKRIEIPEKLEKVLSLLKYVLLFLILRATLLSFNLVFLKVDPYYALLHFFTGEVATAALILLAVVLIASFFLDRPWCRFLCPLGAILGPLGKISLFKVRRPSSKCIGCGACSRACPVGLNPDKETTVTSSKCIRCGLCEVSCPPKLKTSNHSFRIFLITALLLTGIFFTSQLFAKGENTAQEGVTASLSTFVPKPQTTIAELATGTGNTLSGIYELLALPDSVDPATDLVDLEDEFEDKTWNWIQERLKHDL